jgi:plasmid stabilization system protein ParE
MTVEWLPEAEDDLVAIGDWLGERNPRAALAVVERVNAILGLLVEGLEGSAARLTDGREARRWPVGTLVIYDRRRADVLEVLRVHDARRADRARVSARLCARSTRPPRESAPRHGQRASPPGAAPPHRPTRATRRRCN